METRERIAQTGGWAALGAAATVVTGGTPIGVAIVAALAGTLAWRVTRRRAR